MFILCNCSDEPKLVYWLHTNKPTSEFAVVNSLFNCCRTKFEVIIVNVFLKQYFCWTNFVSCRVTLIQGYPYSGLPLFSVFYIQGPENILRGLIMFCKILTSRILTFFLSTFAIFSLFLHSLLFRFFWASSFFLAMDNFLAFLISQVLAIIFLLNLQFFEFFWHFLSFWGFKHQRLRNFFRGLIICYFIVYGCNF